jgi:hypothetical protein
VTNAVGESRAWWWLPVLAAVLFAALAGHAAWVDAPTVDEFAHVPAGCAYLRHGRLDLYAKNPPLAKYLLAAPLALDPSVVVPPPPEQPLGWAPVEYGEAFQQANFGRYLALMFRARLVNVALALACAGVLLAWSTPLIGRRGACLATAMLLLCPNIHAHSHVATTDIACMLTIALTLWAATWAYASPTAGPRYPWWKFALVGAAWGAALLTKFTAVLLLPALLAIALVLRGGEPRPVRTRLVRAAGDVVITCVAALAAIHAGMLFQGLFVPLGDQQFMSNLMLAAQRAMPWLPSPLPADYLLGFDAQLFDTQGGEFGSYLMGQWSQRGWWYYNAVAMAVKTPVLTLALIAVGIGAWWRQRRSIGVTATACVWVPAAVLLVMMMLFNRLNIGVRYLLPLWPVLLLAAGSTWRGWRGRRADAALVGAALIAAGTLVLAHRNTLAYFNAPSKWYGPPEAWLLDSNLDWGQDLSRLNRVWENLEIEGPVYLLQYGHASPRLYGIDSQLAPPWPVNGWVIVSVNYLRGAAYRASAPDGRLVTIKRGHVDWLRGREPVAKVGGLWVFSVRDAPPRGASPGRAGHAR